MVISRRKKSFREGSFMIEAMVSIVLAIVGLLGILNLIVHSLRSNNDIVNRFTAVNLAAEGVEVVKNLIDINQAKGLTWNDGVDSGTYELAYDCVSFDSPVSHCLLIGDIGLGQNPDVIFNDRANFLNFHDNLYDYQELGEPTVFKRVILVENLGIDFDGNGLQAEDEIKVNSLVRWSERGRVFTIDLEDHFFNWRQPSEEN